MDNDSYPLPEGLDNNLKSVESNSSSSLGGKNKNQEENEDYRGQNEEVEAEIVADDKLEKYEEELTGIKIKYDLTKNEVKQFIRRGSEYERNKSIQKKYVIIQGILFIILMSMSIIGNFFHIRNSSCYMLLAIVPFIALILIRFIPFMNMNIMANGLLKENEFSVDIFPDRLEIESKSGQRTIYLDGSYESDEYKNLIMIFKSGDPGIIIPIRAIDPDFRADVQAIIVAGTNPVWFVYFVN